MGRRDDQTKIPIPFQIVSLNGASLAPLPELQQSAIESKRQPRWTPSRVPA